MVIQLYRFVRKGWVLLSVNYTSTSQTLKNTISPINALMVNLKQLKRLYVRNWSACVQRPVDYNFLLLEHSTGMVWCLFLFLLLQGASGPPEPCKVKKNLLGLQSLYSLFIVLWGTVLATLRLWGNTLAAVFLQHLFQIKSLIFNIISQSDSLQEFEKGLVKWTFEIGIGWARGKRKIWLLFWKSILCFI